MLTDSLTLSYYYQNGLQVGLLLLFQLFETGRSDYWLPYIFDVISSRPIFFSNGLITAVFLCLEKIPCSNEVLTILVIGSITEGSISFSSFIGIGSISHDFVFIPKMIFVTSLVLSGSNAEKVGALPCGTEYFEWVSKLSVMDCILFIKIICKNICQFLITQTRW